MTAGGAWPSADNPQPSQTTPDFDAMTHQERDRWLKNHGTPRAVKLPPEARPILVAAIASFVWFVLLSPLVSAPWGSNLDPDPVDSGTATVTTCHPFFSYPCT